MIIPNFYFIKRIILGFSFLNYGWHLVIFLINVSLYKYLTTNTADLITINFYCHSID